MSTAKKNKKRLREFVTLPGPFQLSQKVHGICTRVRNVFHCHPNVSLFCKMPHKLTLPIFVTVPVATTLLPAVALPLMSLSTTWKFLISWMPMMFYASLSPYTCSSAHAISLENPSHLSRSCKTSTTLLKFQADDCSSLAKEFLSSIFFTYKHIPAL